jgi:hypothetical protein
MKSIDPEFLTLGRNILSSQHGSIGGGFITIRLDLHTTYTQREREGYTMEEKQEGDEVKKNTIMPLKPMPFNHSSFPTSERERD